MTGKSALISALELHDILHLPNVRVIDASYGQPPSGMGIEKAADFDIDLIADLSSPQPHTLPKPEFFGEMAGKLGISNDDMVVVYDCSGIAFAAARVWWMFRVFGHNNVRILDGGLPAWKAAGFTLEKKSAAAQPVFFSAKFRPELFKQQNDIQENIQSKKFSLLDARDAQRYSGEIPDPRPHVAAGHIPDSLNLPFAMLINPDGGTFKSKDDLKDIVRKSGVDLSKPIACSCGSGVTACVIALALHEIGHPDAAIYGGSWTEWGGNPALPKNKGTEP